MAEKRTQFPPLFPIFVGLQTRYGRQFFFHSKLFQRRRNSGGGLVWSLVVVDCLEETRIWAPHDWVTRYAALHRTAKQGCRSRGWGMAPQILKDRLFLSQPGGGGQIMSTTLLKAMLGWALTSFAFGFILNFALLPMWTKFKVELNAHQSKLTT